MKTTTTTKTRIEVNGDIADLYRTASMCGDLRLIRQLWHKVDKAYPQTAKADDAGLEEQGSRVYLVLHYNRK